MKIGFLSHLDLNLYAFRLPVMQELAKLGHTPIAIAPQGHYLQKIADCGIQTISYEISRKSLNPFKELSAINNIYKAIKTLNLDILHTFTAKPNIYGTIAGKMANVPKIYNLVEGLGSFYLEDNFKSIAVRNTIEKLYKIVFSMSNGVMFVNSDDPEYFASKNIISTSKIHKIDGVGIDTNEWLPQQKINNTLRITMVARAIKHKGTLEFIKAAQILKEKYPDVIFTYVGAPDAGNPSSLDESILQNESAIEYLGERSDVKEILQESDIFVLPSYREGLPRTALEAMSLALPIVTTNAPGCKDAVSDKINGFIVPVKDEIALLDAIQKLITDKDLREKFGKKSREIACERFDIKPIVQKHLELYQINTQVPL